MYTAALFALLATTEYVSVEAARPITRRQSDTPVALWGACNFPSEGINGPLACADGSECICKDDSTCKVPPDCHPADKIFLESPHYAQSLD